MPRYIIEREVGPKTREEIEAVARKSKQVIASLSGVVWIKSYISEAEGKIYCEYDAPNPEAVREHARLTGIPANKITEITLEISPEMFV
jgi:uncharacterized protein DUF4242